MLFLVGVEPIDGIDVHGVRLIKVGEGHHDGSTFIETSETNT